MPDEKHATSVLTPPPHPAAGILLVEGHAVLRRTIDGWLRDRFGPIGVQAVRDGAGALRFLRRAPAAPRVVLLDIDPMGARGIETGRLLKAMCPRSDLVVLSMLGAVRYRQESCAAGASAYVVKESAADILIPTLADLIVPPPRVNGPWPGDIPQPIPSTRPLMDQRPDRR